MVLCLTNGLTIYVNLLHKHYLTEKSVYKNFLFIDLLMVDKHSNFILNFSILLKSMYPVLFLFDH